jgi:hypothetical protein
MNKSMNVREWVKLFEQIGLSHDQMKQWHKLFEAQHPDAHQHFLEWLGLPANEVARIRLESR